MRCASSARAVLVLTRLRISSLAALGSGIAAPSGVPDKFILLVGLILACSLSPPLTKCPLRQRLYIARRCPPTEEAGQPAYEAVSRQRSLGHSRQPLSSLEASGIREDFRHDLHREIFGIEFARNVRLLLAHQLATQMHQDLRDIDLHRARVITCST